MMLGEQSRPSPDFRKPTKVFDFFSGCGSTSAGLRAAGMEIAFGLDNDRDAGQTFRANFPEAAFLCEDIQELATGSLGRFAEGCGDHPLLFSACAPCQRFLSKGGIQSLRTTAASVFSPICCDLWKSTGLKSLRRERARSTQERHRPGGIQLLATSKIGTL